MAWGDSANIVTTNLDAGTDSPATARSDLKAALEELINVIDGLGTAEGPAQLDANSLLNIVQAHHEYGTAFPAVGTKPYGYRVFRTDLGEWFTLMDATAWGGTGNAWVGDKVVTVGGGRNASSNVSPMQLNGFADTSFLRSDMGYYMQHDYLVTGVVMSMDTARAGNDFTFKLHRGATEILALATTTEYHVEMGEAASNWIEFDSGDVLWAEVIIDGPDAIEDPLFRVHLQRVIAAT